jgi:hypothetical protein
VHVRRQVKLVDGRQLFAPPTGRKVRDVPVPESVALKLAAHLQAWPAATIALPWEDPSGPASSAELVLSTRETTFAAAQLRQRQGVEARPRRGRS